MTQPVPRIGRVLDLVGLVVLLLGALTWAHGWLGLRAMPGGRARSGAPPGAVAEAERLLAWSHAGALLMAIGVAIFVAAAVVAHRVQRTRVVP